jgi:hypothetical protein
MQEWQSSTSTISALRRRMPISWLWVNCHSLSCTVQSVLTRVLRRAVLNPKKKMGHFTKHWPEDVVKEVEDAVRKRVSRSIFRLILHVADSLRLSLKFIERYSERNNKEQPQATSVRKMAASSKKPGRQNVDDTDSESDEEDCQKVSNTTDSYLDEWQLYLNTHEVVSDDVGIVRWWGVRLIFYSLIKLLIPLL